MKPVLVWNLPTRLLHWLLAIGCSAAFLLAVGAPEKSRIFDCHMLIGLILMPLVFIRLIKGTAGAGYASFGAFLYHRKESFEYLIHKATCKPPQHLSHYPAASYLILAMLTLVFGCTISGLLIPASKLFQELHEILVVILPGIIGVHLAGVLFHTMVHKRNVILSMLTGTKMVQEGKGIRLQHALIAVFLLLLTGTWTAAVVKSYDFTTQRLEVPLIGGVMQFGKNAQDDDTHREENDD